MTISMVASRMYLSVDCHVEVPFMLNSLTDMFCCRCTRCAWPTLSMTTLIDFYAKMAHANSKRWLGV